jgi:hypothetical protein
MQAQRVHRGCASAGTDACVNGTVVVKVKHVIDRGRGRCAVHKENSHNTKGRKGKSKK